METASWLQLSLQQQSFPWTIFLFMLAPLAITVPFPHINMFFWNAPPYGLFKISHCSASHAKHTEILFFQPVWFLCTPDFSSQRYTPTHFFSGNLVSTPEKLLFLKKIYHPSLNVHFWEIIHDIISISPNSSTLKCILKSTSIKNHSQPSGHEQSFLIFQFFQIPKQVDLNINLVKVKAYIGF